MQMVRTRLYIRFASDPQIALQVAPHPCSPKENGLLSCAAGMLIISYLAVFPHIPEPL